MNNIKMKTGTVVGTGATIDVDCGVTPNSVRVYNPVTGAKLWWTADMPDGYAHKYAPVGTGMLKSAGLAIGSTKDQIATVACTAQISGNTIAVAAVSAGTAPTAEAIPTLTWGLFGLQVPISGTIAAGPDGADNTTGYATEALAIAGIEATTAAHARMGYVTVYNGSAGDFTGATTNFDAADMVATFYSDDLLSYITSLGITPLGLGDDADVYQGFQIGADTDVNVAGDTLYYEISGD